MKRLIFLCILPLLIDGCKTTSQNPSNSNAFDSTIYKLVEGSKIETVKGPKKMTFDPGEEMEYKLTYLANENIQKLSLHLIYKTILEKNESIPYFSEALASDGTVLDFFIQDFQVKDGIATQSIFITIPLQSLNAEQLNIQLTSKTSVCSIEFDHGYLKSLMTKINELKPEGYLT